MKKIGRYDIVKTIGEGGAGVVYEAHDPFLNREVAIKILKKTHKATSHFSRRFVKKARLVSKIADANILVVYDIGVHDERPYVVMELLGGRSLQEIIKQRIALSTDEKIDIILQAAKGLRTAHASSLVHREIKPGNIRVLEDGRVKLMDFSASRSPSDETIRMHVMGSFYYMSPEQIERPKSADGRSDFFSLGMVFYELLTFRKPFPDSGFPYLQKLCQEPHIPLHEFAEGPYSYLSDIVNRLLEKDPGNRYQSAQDLIDDLTSRKPREKAPEEEVKRDVDQEAATVILGPGEHLKSESPDDSARRKAEGESKRIRKVKRLFEKAQRYVGEKRFGEAQGLAEEILSIEPDHAGTRKLLSKVRRITDNVSRLVEKARTELRQGRLSEAMGTVEEARKIEPHDKEVMELRATLQEHGQHSRDKQIAVLVAQAKSDMQEGRFSKALKVLKKARDLDPNNEKIRKLTHEIEKFEKNRRRVTSLVNQAKSANEDNDLFNALSLLNEANQLAPQNKKIEKLISETRNRINRKKQVERLVEDASSQLNRKKYSGALKTLQKAHALDSQDKAVLYLMEIAQKKRGSLLSRYGKTTIFSVSMGIALLALLLGLGRLLDRGPWTKEQFKYLEHKKAVVETLIDDAYSCVRNPVSVEQYEDAISSYEGVLKEIKTTKWSYRHLLQPYKAHAKERIASLNLASASLKEKIEAYKSETQRVSQQAGHLVEQACILDAIDLLKKHSEKVRPYPALSQEVNQMQSKIAAFNAMVTHLKEVINKARFDCNIKHSREAFSSSVSLIDALELLQPYEQTLRSLDDLMSRYRHESAFDDQCPMTLSSEISEVLHAIREKGQDSSISRSAVQGQCRKALSSGISDLLDLARTRERKAPIQVAGLYNRLHLNYSAYLNEDQRNGIADSTERMKEVLTRKMDSLYDSGACAEALDVAGILETALGEERKLRARIGESDIRGLVCKIRIIEDFLSDGDCARAERTLGSLKDEADGVADFRDSIDYIQAAVIECKQAVVEEQLAKGRCEEAERALADLAAHQHQDPKIPGLIAELEEKTKICKIKEECRPYIDQVPKDIAGGDLDQANFNIIISRSICPENPEIEAFAKTVERRKEQSRQLTKQAEVELQQPGGIDIGKAEELLVPALRLNKSDRLAASLLEQVRTTRSDLARRMKAAKADMNDGDGRYDEAERIVSEICSKYDYEPALTLRETIDGLTGSWDELLGNAVLALNQGRIDEARSAVDKVLKKKPNYKPALEIDELIKDQKGFAEEILEKANVMLSKGCVDVALSLAQEIQGYREAERLALSLHIVSEYIENAREMAKNNDFLGAANALQRCTAQHAKDMNRIKPNKLVSVVFFNASLEAAKGFDCDKAEKYAQLAVEFGDPEWLSKKQFGKPLMDVLKDFQSHLSSSENRKACRGHDKKIQSPIGTTYQAEPLDHRCPKY
ncbi:protein kinase [Acidobacteriota bacterium]